MSFGFSSTDTLSDEASMQNMWIYDKDKHVWYTPERVLKLYMATGKCILKDLEHFVIRDPIAGIKAAHKEMKLQSTRMEELRERLHEFSIKVFKILLERAKV
jgi:hypothetical protein